MSDKKNIERFFQEKFKDYEVNPDPKVWDSIASKLENKKNKKRILPIWFKTIGIAASLVIGYFIISNYSTGEKTKDKYHNVDENVVSSDEKTNDKKSNNKYYDTNENVVSSDEKTNDKKSNNKYYVTDENVVSTGEKSNNKKSNNKYHNVDENVVSTGEKSNKKKSNNKYHNVDENVVSSGEKTKNKKSNDKYYNVDENVVSSDKKSNDKYYDTDKNVVSSHEKINNKKSNDKYYDIQENIVSSNKKSNNKNYDTDENVVSSYEKSNDKYYNVDENVVSSDEKTKIKKSNNKYYNVDENVVSSDEKTKDKKSDIQENIVSSNKKSNNKKLASYKTNAIAKTTKNESLEKEQINQKLKENKVLIPVQNKNEITQNNQSKKTKSTLDSENNTPLNQEKSNSIVSNNTNLFQKPIPKDSVVTIQIAENPLDKILKEKVAKEKVEDKAIAEKLDKWKVRPNVAPLFMNASAGSPIHDIFKDNKKEYENNLSIGLGVDYAISNKISIRTGFSKFDLAYNTNDVVFYADLTAKNTTSRNNPIQTINMKGDARNMVIEDKKTSKSPELAMQNKDEGYINQRFGYVEVPVEVSYKLIDKKFGIQIITGLSTLFLNNNQVSIVSAGKSTILGDANNLNKIHFSSNIGLGFKYSFWKSFEANFEPTFKYQINTFSDNTGNFNPYLVGLYSGISYKF